MQFYKKVCINILLGIGTVIIPVVANDNGCDYDRDYDRDISMLNIDETMNQNNNTSEHPSTVGSSPASEYRPNQNEIEKIRLSSSEVDYTGKNCYFLSGLKSDKQTFKYEFERFAGYEYIAKPKLGTSAIGEIVKNTESDIYSGTQLVRKFPKNAEIFFKDVGIRIASKLEKEKLIPIAGTIAKQSAPDINSASEFAYPYICPIVEKIPNTVISFVKNFYNSYLLGEYGNYSYDYNTDKWNLVEKISEADAEASTTVIID